MITKQAIDEVFERSDGRCENPSCQHIGNYKYEHHHIYWRSQYNKSDRDEAWNLAYICQRCHTSIHVTGNRELDQYLKQCADNRKEREKRSNKISKDILRARQARKNSYKRTIESFKKKNEGKTPSQIAYQRQKLYKQSL